jgi:hypothetical protein
METLIFIAIKFWGDIKETKMEWNYVDRPLSLSGLCFYEFNNLTMGGDVISSDVDLYQESGHQITLLTRDFYRQLQNDTGK